MKIRKVTIRNLNSLRQEESINFMDLPLANTGLFAIVGETGAGKSTILDAITLALYGKMPRNKNVKEVLSYGAVEALAEVEFEHNDKIYRAKWMIHRSRGKVSGNIQEPKRILEEWVDHKQAFQIVGEKVREVDEKVANFTGLDYNRFRRSVLLAQGDFAAFLDASERERSELLERITGTEIYSTLSKAAFERHKQEKDQLDQIQRTIETLKLLPEDNINALKAELVTLDTDTQAQKNELEKIQLQLELYQRLSHNSTRLAELEKNWSQLQDQWQKAQPEFNKLAQFEKATPYFSDLKLLDDLTIRIKQLETQIEDLSQQLEKDQAQYLEEVQRGKTLENTFVSLKANFRQEEQKWKKTREFDAKIGKQKEIVSGKEKEYQSILSDLQQLEEDLKSQYIELQNLNDQLEHLSIWLSKNKQYQRLGEKFFLLEREMKEWKSEKKDLAQLETNFQQLEKETKLLGQQYEQIESKRLHSQSKLAELKKTLTVKKPGSYILDRNLIIEEFDKELDILSTQQRQLEDLQRWSENYQKILAELKNYEEKVQTLRAEESLLNKDLLTLFDQLEDARIRKEERFQIFQQQQLIANYEKDRANLKEGEACPLCMSKDHPFRELQLKPYPDRARQDYERAAEFLEKLESTSRKNQQRQQQIIYELNQIEGDEFKSLAGKQQKLQEELMSRESEFQKLLVLPTADDSISVNQEKLSRHIAQNEKTFRERKEQRESIRKILIQIDQKEKILSEQEVGSRSIKAQQEIANNNAQQLQQQVVIKQQRLESLYQSIQKELDYFKVKLKEEVIEEQIQQLKEWRETYELKAFEQQDIKLQLSRIQSKIAENKKILQKLEKSSSIRKQWFEQEQNRLDKLLEERQSLFGGKDPDEEQEKLEAAIEVSEQERKDAMEVRNQLKNRMDVNMANHDRSQKEVTGYKQKLEEDEAILMENIQLIDLTSLDALRMIVLTETEAAAIRENRNDLNKRQIETQKLKEESLSAQEKLTKALEGVEEQDNLMERFKELETQRANGYKRLGEIKGILDANQSQQQEQQQLLTQLSQQQKEYDRWAKLNELIGTADGKKFRIFAQALTLQKLVLLANYHLSRLNGRYLIEKKAGNDLALDVIDTYQANFKRSMNTLSGGERFLVSLSLALGLSDLASRNSKIQSLFIDEGFGTLDDNSLDLVLSTLENLHADGKTIGVISHVKELKERIGTQIQVLRKESGFSTIQIVSG